MLLSIIIPVYNTEKYLKKCLYSILNQIDFNVEIIAIDDGSTDSSGKICDEIASRDRRLNVFHTSNQGVSAARNFALDRAKGEYITFVDSDDYWLDDAYYIYKKYLNKKCDLVYAQSYMVSYSNGRKRKFKRKLNIFQQCNNSVFEQICDSIGNGGWSNCLCYFKRNIIEDNGIRYRLGTLIGEDAEFFLEFCKCINLVEIVDKEYYVYRVNRCGSAMTEMNINAIVSYLNLIENRVRTYEKTNDSKDLCILKILIANCFEHLKWFELCNKSDKEKYVRKLEIEHFDRYLDEDNRLLKSIKKNGYSKMIEKEWNKYYKLQYIKNTIKKIIHY